MLATIALQAAAPPPPGQAPPEALGDGAAPGVLFGDALRRAVAGLGLPGGRLAGVGFGMGQVAAQGVVQDIGLPGIAGPASGVPADPMLADAWPRGGLGTAAVVAPSGNVQADGTPIADDDDDDAALADVSLLAILGLGMTLAPAADTPAALPGEAMPGQFAVGETTGISMAAAPETLAPADPSLPAVTPPAVAPPAVVPAGFAASASEPGGSGRLASAPPEVAPAGSPPPLTAASLPPPAPLAAAASLSQPRRASGSDQAEADDAAGLSAGVDHAGTAAGVEGQAGPAVARPAPAGDQTPTATLAARQPVPPTAPPVATRGRPATTPPDAGSETGAMRLPPTDPAAPTAAAPPSSRLDAAAAPPEMAPAAPPATPPSPLAAALAELVPAGRAHTSATQPGAAPAGTDAPPPTTPALPDGAAGGATPAAATAAPPEAPRAAPIAPSRQVLPIAIAMLIAPGVTPTLSVTLEPAELGRLEIRIGRGEGGASLRLIADRPETMALLARDQRELQQGLAQSGIGLNADGISFEMAGDGGARRDPQQGRQPAPGRATPREGPASLAQATGQNSLLDMRV